MHKKYRKRPIIVEAIQFFKDSERDTLTECIAFTKNTVSWSPYEEFRILIPSLEGDIPVNNGDYIIKGVEGGFYLCKPEIFEKTYDMLKEGE